MPQTLTGSITAGTPSVSGNYTPVTVTLHIQASGSAHAYDDPPGSITINGSTKSFTHNYGYNANEDIASYTVNVPHNSDGTKTVACSGYYEGYAKGWGSEYYLYWSDSKTLPTIPRISDIAVQSSSVTAGGTQKVTCTKKSSSFTDTITVSCGSKSMTVTSGTSFTIPENWMTEFTGASSATATATVTTRSGSTVIGANSANFTINASNYTIPASVSISPNSTPAVFGNRYVQLLSKVAVSTSASGYQGSSIASIVSTIEGISYTGASITSGYLATSGSVAVRTVVTDSRGKTRTFSNTITVTPYHYPQLAISAIARQSDNTCRVNLQGEISAVDNLNAKTYTVTWVDNEGGSGTLANAVVLSSYTFDFDVTHQNIDPSLTYTYTVRATDSVGFAQRVVATGIVCMSRHAGGDGITFGGEASSSGLVSHWDATFNGTATFNDTAVVNHSSGGDLGVRKIRNIFISSTEPTDDDGEDGDIWMVYEV